MPIKFVLLVDAYILNATYFLEIVWFILHIYCIDSLTDVNFGFLLPEKTIRIVDLIVDSRYKEDFDVQSKSFKKIKGLKSKQRHPNQN